MYILYIYIYIYVYMFICKCLNSWLPYVTKIKVKGKSIKVLYACMVHEKELGFFFLEGREE